LPLILCGPMLRRVSSRSVSVFLALKHACTVALELFESPAERLARVSSEAQATLPIGRHLHLVVVTLVLASDLEPGRRYGYNLVFHADGWPAEGVSLRNDPEHLLTGDNPLGGGESSLVYAADELPSFMLPAREVEGLRVLHGSCRKPHGDGSDMLTLLDDLLIATHDRPAERPQLLLLTGDQIYADDVSPILLRCLNDSAIELLGWQETVPAPLFVLPGWAAGLQLPGATDQTLASDGPWKHVSVDDVNSVAHLLDPGRAARIAPPKRGDEMRRNAGLSSELADAHLMFFGEFLLMYLFCWSDTLWPRNGSAEPERAGAFGLPLYNEAAPSFSLFGTYSQNALMAQRSTLMQFAAGLKKVRRALANTPTLMIFDDHEVTDDWNLNADWVGRVNASPLGARVLRNALLAYALCQDWGSQPADYEPAGTGAPLLDAVRSTGNVPTIGERPDELFERLAIGPAFCRQPPLKRWDYTFEPHAMPGAGYRLLLLDTRTRRGFPSQTAVDSAVSALKQLIDDGNPSAGLVLNAALLSDAAFGEQLESRIDAGRVNLIVSPAPLFGVAFIENVMQRALVLKSGAEVADNESWSGDQAAFRRFVDVLREARTGAVVLSGDVHYAFSHGIAFPEGQAGAVRRGAVQLCSSALKNELAAMNSAAMLEPPAGQNWCDVAPGRAAEIQSMVDGGLRSKLHEMRLDNRIDPSDLEAWRKYAWDDWFWKTPGWWDPAQFILNFRDLNPFALPGKLMLPIRLAQGVALAGGVFDWLDTDFIHHNEHFRAQHATDDRSTAERRAEPAGLNSGREAPTSAEDTGGQLARQLVPYNNLGLIGFERGGGTTRVVHTLYWPLHAEQVGDHPPFFSTRHTIVLTE
jgi:hypothetical protein